jgi:hypothetical protein
MRIRRGPLFWGLFLIPLGAVPLLVRAGVIEGDLIAEAWRLWPLILVGLGLTLLIGRGAVGLVATSAFALVLGIAVGGALATGSLGSGVPFSGVGDCDLAGTADQALDETGTFEAPAQVLLDFDCGTFDVSTAPSGPWTVAARYSRGAPIVDAAATRLEVRVPDADTGRQEWELQVPQDRLRQVDLTANASSGTIDLAGAVLERIRVDANASDLLLDAGAVDRIDLHLNAGRARITLGAAATTGDLSTNAGAIDLCVPPNAELTFHVTEQLTFAHNLDGQGLTQDGTTWTRSGSGGPSIELTVDGNAASFTLDPQGGCK